MNVKKYCFFISASSLLSMTNYATADLDPNRFEIQDVNVSMSIQDDAAYPIYANGRMQAPVDIALKIYDKINSQYIQLTETQLKNAIILTDINGVVLTFNQPVNNSWGFTFTENSFSHRIKERSKRSSSSQVSSSPVWSNLRAYVYTDEEVYEKKICIAVKFTSDQTFNSCSGNFDEYARIESKSEKTYIADFFTLSQTKLWDSNDEDWDSSLNQQLYQHYISHKQGIKLHSVGRVGTWRGETVIRYPEADNILTFSMHGEGGTAWFIPSLTKTHYSYMGTPYPINNRKGQLSILRITSPDNPVSPESPAYRHVVNKQPLYILDKYGNESTISLEFSSDESKWVLLD
ncbi:hypothetical protein H0A36_15180 [Endozoicomonas sp. SM1973]|uniref:Uncharacterized protein n=1 Tax=Spartinivicinus marinus TaxID=2994442 RepID=A0A853I3Z4_9GAMM|nr:hypothetical protein [Spartinivicinus marinus]MCX4026228.1 hypothetical protein [Spartinivicinus marinus]NYZ67359.1 hypothetical protein [Spartinivicinus marinus]